ncbi:MAG TPA: GNAT family N-acetyltransferase [Candidatus Baltobacteraceae bacterium]|jgi:ribosomal protein S18 acetylase RimI-like enzyme
MPEAAIRRAVRADLPEVVALLADDVLGRTRERVEDPLPQCYAEAFSAIDADPNQQVLVCVRDGRAIGCLQLTFIPGLSHQGSWRAQIEGVRVASTARGEKIGERMMVYAIDAARERRCRIVQLTTAKSRPDAHRFYERLGFTASHEGMKLTL